MDTISKKYILNVIAHNIEYLEMQYKYSKLKCLEKFDESKHRYDFIQLLDQLDYSGRYPVGTYYAFDEYTPLNIDEYFSRNNFSDDVMKNIGQIKKDMVEQHNIFKKYVKKPEGDLATNLNIFYNYAHYEIRDFIIKDKNAEMCTNAWVKMYDLIMANLRHQFVDGSIKQLRSFHMCELPGAFIAALNHFTKTFMKCELNWTAQSLFDARSKNMLSDQYGLYKTYKKNYDLGVTGTGDLYETKNVEAYVEKYGKEHFDIITSDCGEELDEGADVKEDQITELQWHQFIVAIGLKPDVYFCKLYSTYTKNTNKLIMLANVFFKNVKLYKPYTVKITSDEVYLCCKNPRNYDSSIWKKLLRTNIDDIMIDKNFHDHMYTYTKMFFLERSLNMNYMLFVYNNIEYILKKNNDSCSGGVPRIKVFQNLTRIVRNGLIYSYVNGILMLQPINEKDKLLPNVKTAKAFDQNFGMDIEFIDCSKK